MYHKHGQHKAPYFHATYGEFDASFAILSGEVLSGYLPRKVEALVHEWAERHRNELMENWQKAMNREPLAKIVGADND